MVREANFCPTLLRQLVTCFLSSSGRWVYVFLQGCMHTRDASLYKINSGTVANVTCPSAFLLTCRRPASTDSGHFCTLSPNPSRRQVPIYLGRREGTPTWTRLAWHRLLCSMVARHCRYFSWWARISVVRVEPRLRKASRLGVGCGGKARSFSSVRSSCEIGMPNSWFKSLIMAEEGSRSLTITSLSRVLVWQMS